MQSKQKSVIVEGRLTRDREVKYTKPRWEGDIGRQFTVLYLRENGQRWPRRIVIWNSHLPMNIGARIARQGHLLRVTGTFEEIPYVKDGQHRVLRQIVADSIEFLDRQPPPSEDRRFEVSRRERRDPNAPTYQVLSITRAPKSD